MPRHAVSACGTASLMQCCYFLHVVSELPTDTRNLSHSLPSRFKHAEFYQEVRRILKPSGTFAAWTYCLPVLNHRHHPAQAVLQQLYQGTLGPYWAEPRKHVDAGYRGIEPSPDDFLTLVRRELEVSKEQTVDDLVRSRVGLHVSSNKHNVHMLSPSQQQGSTLWIALPIIPCAVHMLQQADG